MTNYTDWNDLEPPRHTGSVPSGFDWQRFMTERMGAVSEWLDVCKPCQEPLESRAPGEWWANMEEVFHHD